MLSIIVAMSPNHAIGYQGSLPWHIPEDLAHFKALTMGHTIIMGRKTFESLPHGALPGRRNVVLSRTITTLPGCDVFTNLQNAISNCNGNLLGKSLLSNDVSDNELFIIGGASVYAEALPLADRLYITLVDTDPENADTFFPHFDLSQWVETKKEKHSGFSFITLVHSLSL